MKRKVTAMQFEIKRDRILHKPTGAEFLRVGGNVVAFAWCRAGQALGSGDWYPAEDVKRVAKEIARTEKQL